MKKIFAFVLFVALMINVCFHTFSFSGWNLIDGEYVYLNSQGQKLQNSWIKSGDATYYLDDNGFILKNTLFQYDDDYYYLDMTGKRISSTFIYINENVNAPDEVKDGIYFLDENGRMVRKTNNSNFKRYIEGAYYAFDEEGLFCEGWFNKDGDRLTEPSEYITDGVYYTDGTGHLYQNRWYNFSDDVGSTVISDPDNNISGSSYDDMNNLWMYFDSTCKKVASTDDKSKIKEINGTKYAFDNNGVMLEGFTKNDTLDYTQLSNPSLTETIKLYSFEDGSAYKNKWIKVAPSKYMSSTDFYDDATSWYYVDNSGNIVYNKLKTIDGERYMFDGVGRMKTGFGFMDGKNFFVSNYKPEDLTRDDFIYPVTAGGHLYGSDINDLRYFGSDDDNGKMLTGDIKIELADGEYEFGFRKSQGIAYGNRNTLMKHNNAYYINGLKLTPIEDMKYGVVKVSDDQYVVVNSKGKIMKGNKKLLKDDYGNTLVIMSDNLAAYIVDAQDKVKLRWVKTSVASISNLPGYYYYNNEYEVKDYTAIAVPSGTTCPTPAQLKNIPVEMRVNFR